MYQLQLWTVIDQVWSVQGKSWACLMVCKDWQGEVWAMVDFYPMSAEEWSRYRGR